MCDIECTVFRFPISHHISVKSRNMMMTFITHVMQQAAAPKKEPAPQVDREVEEKPQLSGEALGFHNPGTHL